MVNVTLPAVDLIGLTAKLLLMTTLPVPNEYARSTVSVGETVTVLNVIFPPVKVTSLSDVNWT